MSCEGYVKCYNMEKGFGFIIPAHPGAPEIFVHHLGIQGQQLQEGDEVFFDVEYDKEKDKEKAINVIGGTGGHARVVPNAWGGGGYGGGFGGGFPQPGFGGKGKGKMDYGGGGYGGGFGGGKKGDFGGGFGGGFGGKPMGKGDFGGGFGGKPMGKGDWGGGGGYGAPAYGKGKGFY